MLSRQTAILLLTTAAVTAVTVVFSLWPNSPLADGELGAQDFLARQGRRAPANPKLIFLAIDKASISIDAQHDLQALFGTDNTDSPEGRALQMMSQSWPWPRGVYALILDRLIGAGAKVVALDLIFPTPSEHDAEFRAAIERHAGKVVIGSNFIGSSQPDEHGYNVDLTSPTPELIPQTGVPDPRVGFINFWPDQDGIVRHAEFRTNVARIFGANSGPDEADSFSLAARAVAKSGRVEVIPTGHASHAFRYTAGPQAGFAPHSVFEIFAPEYWARNYQSGAVFKDAIVIVGAAGNWQHDEHQTPFGLMPGPELQLNVMNALLHREFLRPLAWPVWWLLYAVMGAVTFACCYFCKSPLLRIGALLAVAAGWIAGQFFLFNHLGYFGPFVGPLTVLTLTGLLSIVHDLVRAGAEQLRLRRNLAERKRIQEGLETANDELERRVQERTKELTQTNHKLAGLLDEKELLLKEVHHRVKNNLQVISSLLNLQADYIKDPAALQIFTESRNRVRSMALIHEKLYQSHDLARIDFADYIRSLTSSLLAGYAQKSSQVRISVEIEQMMLGVDAAVPCGLIVNELVTNCFKYAFTNGRPGQIQIAMVRQPGEQLRLSVADDGVGFPKDVDFRNTESLGMQIITTLSEQLEGTVQMSNTAGTEFAICFPENN